MANTRSHNVICVDTTATFDEVTRIRSILFVGNAADSSVTITAATSLAPLWEASGDIERLDSDVMIRGNRGIVVTVATGGKAYLYLE